MEDSARVYGLTMASLPVWNLEEELIAHMNLLADDGFRARLRVMNEPIETPYMIWKGLPWGLLTHFVQRAILGIEGCIPVRVSLAAEVSGRLTPQLAALCDEPTKLGSKSTMAHSLYNLMPALVDEAFALRRSDQRLWSEVKVFYKEVRNPLFHGHQLHPPTTADSVLEVLDLVRRLYDWTRLWAPA